MTAVGLIDRIRLHCWRLWAAWGTRTYSQSRRSSFPHGNAKGLS